MNNDFRPFVPAPEQSRIAGNTVRSHTEARLKLPRPQSLFAAWEALYQHPFQGITTAGNLLSGLYSLKPEQAPTEHAVTATHHLLNHLSNEQRNSTVFEIDSKQWRNWQNTEMFVSDHGLRLEFVSSEVREGVLTVLKACLSAKGYETCRNVMKLNHFLGELVGSTAVMGEWSFTFSLFGTPSMQAPWGWQLYGHHLCLNCFILEEQMVLSPTFMGAEPKYADEGRFAGITLFQDEERLGLDLMNSLTSRQQEQAIVAHSMMGGDLPECRRHFADGLHLGGAYQDNRIIPYEGLQASELSKGQQQQFFKLLEAYLSLLPSGPKKARLEEVGRYLSETHFCWIGSQQENEAFYYRIQSPVLMIEFDHHAGVFLTNEEPASFHVHTLLRTPNGNDYGMDLLRLHYQSASHHNHSSK